ncbi:hypothetical protein GQ43DRAFT_67769 [Delitschia confertaspora ATCC 74209]|uniref:Uncharacterized protein n=1 Tax=Delitschia confertaspora ATCC 74209 TaxID=1513339 RepID=A0A9P4JZ07_9PLEO|nr:hypothetical protein GQ43DRAFT_67769 [Delitschia confertaspora ATCC 74209]
MPNLEAQLSSELSRIIASPYPVSLSNLAELLATGDDLTIRKCINDRPPCLITRLAGLVAAALPLWSFALSALQRLCCCLEFKEEFLLQNPTLLNTLITRAGASSCDFDKYFELCVLLLSDPLPDALPLPASAHAFFLRAFEHSTRSPCVGTLKPVYRMLNGACQGLLAHQPSETRDKFEKELLSLFSSDPTKQDSVLWLWCFGLVILAEYPEESGRMQSTSSILPPQTAVQRNDGSEKKWRTSAGRKLFGSAGSMLKTINLISLNVILACKANPGISDNEAMEGIRIAMKTLQAINVDVRQHWLDRSPLGKSVPAKLMGKLIGRDIHPGVQLHGICFLALLLNGQNLPHQLTSLYQKALLALPQLDLEPVDLRETLSASLTLFAPFLEQTAVQNLIQAALLAYIRPASLVELNAFQIMAQELTAAIPNFKALCSNILFTLSSNATQGTIREFLRAPALEEVHKHAAADSCETFTSGLRRNLALSIISMLLTSALTTQSEEFGLDQALVLALIKKQSQLSSSRTSCTHTMATSKPHPSISIFEQECTPAASGPYPKDWRERITSELERQSFYQRDTVIRTVAQICQDLENRCEHVEEPLREEKRRVVELQTKVRQLTDHISNLEAESMDRKMMIDGLEAERAQLETDLDRADESNQGLSAAMDQLKREFTDANKKAEETLQAAQQAFHARETEFQTTILNREEALQQRSKEIEELNNAIKHLEENSRNAESEIDNLATLRETLKGRIESVENDLDSERQFRSRATDDINRLKGSELDLTGRLQSCKAEVEHLKGQLEAQEERHRELMQASKEAQEALVSKYETELRVLAEQTKRVPL